MTTHNYKYMLSSAPSRYHKAGRGGDKRMVDYLEKNNYSNESLLACCKVSKDYNNKLNKSVMATKNLLMSGLGQSVMNAIRVRMFDSFCESLISSLSASASADCGVGRLTYAALVATWRKDTANCGYVLNESEGRKLFGADPTDSRVRRVGVDGHWSFFVSPSAKDLEKETDSISVLVGGWLRSWSSWYESVVQYGHYGEGGVPAASSISSELINRCRGLWSIRGVGGRVAATTAEKQQKKVVKAVQGLTTAQLLAALKASGVDLSILTGGAPQTESDNKE